MKKTILSLILCLCLIMPVIAQTKTTQVSTPNNRYQIIMRDSGLQLTILLDTKTGITWRNIGCPDINQKSNQAIDPATSFPQDQNGKLFSPPNCWQKMWYLDGKPQP